MRINLLLITILLCATITASCYAADSELNKCGKAINENTEWQVVSPVFSNQVVRGTPLGFSTLIKSYAESYKYRAEMLDYTFPDWGFFGIVFYKKDGTFQDALLFSAPEKGGYSACGWNAATVFKVVPKSNPAPQIKAIRLK